jgi:hypothetical protein
MPQRSSGWAGESLASQISSRGTLRALQMQRAAPNGTRLSGVWGLLRSVCVLFAPCLVGDILPTVDHDSDTAATPSLLGANVAGF